MPCVVRRAGTPGRRRRGERLDLDQQRTLALHRRRHDRAGHARAAVAEEQVARVGHPDQAVAGHLEQAELVGGAEAVLGGAQQPQRMMAFAFERQHGVDDVLEHPRPGQRALLGDVPDEHDRQVALLGDGHQLVGAAAHLDDRPGRRAERRLVHGLDRVDDDDRRLDLVDRAPRCEPSTSRPATTGRVAPHRAARLATAPAGRSPRR